MEKNISEADFALFRAFIFDRSGISIDSSKAAMVSSRLAKRLRHYGLEKYRDYFSIISDQNNKLEQQVLIDLLTTNETYFFREMAHFDFLKNEHRGALAASKPLRVWSAASSSGEEAYSIAMLLADLFGEGAAWEVFGSDICTEVIKTAQQGLYSDNRIEAVPPQYLRKYCLKGGGPYQNMMLIKPSLKKKVRFSQINLNVALPDVGLFDIIFLRNIMIYFSLETKKEIVRRVVSKLKKGGLFIIGHTETLKNISKDVQRVKPSIYIKG